MMSDKAGNIKDWSNNELREGCVKIEITYHFVIPSVAEGSQDWLSGMFRLRFVPLNMTDTNLGGCTVFTPISYAHVIEGYSPVIQVFYWLHIISSFGNRNQGNFDGYAGS